MKISKQIKFQKESKFRVLKLFHIPSLIVKIGIIYIFILFSLPLTAQMDEEFLIDNTIEDIIQNAPEDFDFTELQENLLNYYYYPLSLNKATKEDFASLYILSPKQIDEIIGYRRRYSNFVTVYELTSIKSLDKETLQRLLLFIKVDPEADKKRLKLKHVFTHGHNRILFKYEQILEKQQGYLFPDTSEAAAGKSYIGSPQKVYLRYDHRVGNKASFGLTTEKDAGEELLTGKYKTPDFYSAHFYLADRKNLKHLAIGDYQTNFGQGLVFYSGLSFGKNPNVLQMFKVPKEISPYRSVNENNFLRGIAATYQIKNLRITGFYSNKKIDGSVGGNDSLENLNEYYFTSFFASGYHRTQNELEKKKAIKEEIIGTRLFRSFKKVEIGITGITGRFDKPLMLTEKPYNKYYFTGNSFTNIGADYSITITNIHLFGEFGFDTRTFAGISGMIININSKINAGFIYRNYPRDYNALYSNAFRAGSKTQNEQGLYFALSLHPSAYWTINAYVDQFSFPWLRYQVDLPSKGYEYLVDSKYSLNYKTNFNFRFKYYKKEKNSPNNETNLNYLTNYSKLNLRININYKLSKQIILRTRVEYCRYQVANNNPTEGLLTFQDFIYNHNEKLRLIGRYSIFNTDDYYSRIYSYENDVLYSFSIPGFSDQGARYYLLTRYKLGRNLSFWFKIAQTTYFHKDSIGSGTSKIEGNNKTEIKFMLRFDF